MNTKKKLMMQIYATVECNRPEHGVELLHQFERAIMADIVSELRDECDVGSEVLSKIVDKMCAFINQRELPL